MVAFSFSIEEQKSRVKNGRKLRTTRPFRTGKKYQIMKKAVENSVKYQIQCYWKMRTKECELLLETIAETVNKVRFLGDTIKIKENGTYRTLTQNELEDFAREDGFDSVQGFFAWFEQNPNLREELYYTTKWVYPPPDWVKDVVKYGNPKFSETKVEYATHQLSLYNGGEDCPHRCRYCFVKRYAKRNWQWAVGPYRLNEKARFIAALAPKKAIETLVLSFTSDPFPRNNPVFSEKEALDYLISILKKLQEREINTKILTKNHNVTKVIGKLERTNFLQFGLSITTNVENQTKATKWEPGASTIEKRFLAVEKLHNNDFQTWISVEPILPDTDFDALFSELELAYPDEVWVGKTNYSNMQQAFDWSQVVKKVYNFQQNTFLNINIKEELYNYLPSYLKHKKPIGLVKFFYRQKLEQEAKK